MHGLHEAISKRWKMDFSSEAPNDDKKTDEGIAVYKNGVSSVYGCFPFPSFIDSIRYVMLL